MFVVHVSDRTASLLSRALVERSAGESDVLAGVAHGITGGHGGARSHCGDERFLAQSCA